jgi:hypothetical protein
MNKSRPNEMQPFARIGCNIDRPPGRFLLSDWAGLRTGEFLRIRTPFVGTEGSGDPTGFAWQQTQRSSPGTVFVAPTFELTFLNTLLSGRQVILVTLQFTLAYGNGGVPSGFVGTFHSTILDGECTYARTIAGANYQLGVAGSFVGDIHVRFASWAEYRAQYGNRP